MEGEKEICLPQAMGPALPKVGYEVEKLSQSQKLKWDASHLPCEMAKRQGILPELLIPSSLSKH